MFHFILGTYVALEFGAEVILAVMIYRRRHMIVPFIRRFLIDAVGTAHVLGKIRNLQTTVEVLIPEPQSDKHFAETIENSESLEETSRRARFELAVEVARRQHKRKPVFEDFQ